MDGANVTRFKANKEDARKVELVIVLHQQKAPEFIALGKATLQASKYWNSWCSRGEVDGTYVFCCTDKDLPMTHDNVEDNAFSGRFTYLIVIDVIQSGRASHSPTLAIATLEFL